MIEETTLWKRKHARLAIAAPLVIAVAAQLALVAAVMFVAWKSDHDLFERQHRTLADYYDDLLVWEAQSTLDLAIWDELVDALEAEPMDAEWLVDHFADSLSTYASTVTAAIVDPDGKLLWVAADGSVVDAAWYADACPRCVEMARTVAARAADPASGFRTFELAARYADRPPLPPSFPVALEVNALDGRPVVVVAAPIARSAPGERAAGPYPILLTVVDVADTYLKDIGKETGIAGVRLETPEPVTRGVPIHATADGRVVADLVWDRVTPAQDLLRSLAPIGLLFMGLFTGLVVALVRWLRRMAVDQVAGEALGNHLATHDPLTGVGNRAFLAVELDRMLPQAQESGTAAALILIDLDGFKGVNDTHGHATGDELIRQFSDRLVQGLPPSCRVVRLGGDEFAILVPDLTERAVAHKLAADILAYARAPFELDGIEARIGCSIGIAFSPDHALDRSELLRKADVALYRAKGDGRNRACVFSAELDDRVREHRSAEENLRAALADGSRFAVVYEPVHALGDAPTPCGMEASLRWRNAAGRLVSARAMRRAAEEVGLVSELGTFVLQQVCRDAARWPERVMTVDVSPLEVVDPTFADRVLMVLDGADVAAARIELELTDGLQHANSREAMRQLNRLRSAGVRLSLDNFGAGYANLTQLRALPLTQIKIAGALVRGLSGSAESRHIVQALVDLGRSSGLTVAAEGVDSPAQLAFLKAGGCQRVQGRALPPDPDAMIPEAPGPTGQIRAA
jgi:diguanylate cyclase (GGDEF)-like protein